MLYSTKRYLVFMAAIAMCCFVSERAQAEPLDEAREHYQRGDGHFKRGDYAAAIVEFEIANRLVPSPVLFYNIGLCHEQLGNVKEAIGEYRAYLREVPKAQNRSAVEARVQRLEAQLVTATPTPSAQPELPEPPRQPDAPTQPPPAPPASAGYTGNDPELRRVSEIDVAAVGRQYQGRGGAPPPPPPGAAQSAPASVPVGGPGTPQSATGPASPEPGGSGQSAQPFYTKWWFWVAAGVGTLILINIAIDDDDNGGTRQNSLTIGAPAAVGGAEAPLLWRF